MQTAIDPLEEILVSVTDIKVFRTLQKALAVSFLRESWRV